MDYPSKESVIDNLMSYVPELKKAKIRKRLEYDTSGMTDKQAFQWFETTGAITQKEKV